MVPGLLQDLRHKRLWWAVGIGLVVLVVYLSLTPEPPDVPDVSGSDPGHLIAYFTLMGWWAQLVRGRGRLIAALALAGLGVGLEYVQALTDYRTFDVVDMRDDLLGVAAAFVLTLSPLGRALAALEARAAAWLR